MEFERTYMPQLVQRTCLGVMSMRSMSFYTEAITAFVKRVRPAHLWV